MKADALALAHPSFELQPGDEIHLDITHRESEEWSSVTFERGFFAIDVNVWRPTARQLGQSLPGQLIFQWTPTGQHYFHAAERRYLNDEAQEFLAELMKRGSARSS